MQTKNSKPAKKQTEAQKRRVRWIITIFFLTVAISALFSFLSSTIMDGASIAAAFAVLFVIVAIGIVFDMIGVSVTAADEKPFHSMAAKKTKGAKEALRLIRNADRVSSICNDVVGDICGVISGSASAAIAVKAVSGETSSTLVTLLMSALVAGLTVGGKACGKSFAMTQATNIVHMAATLIYYIKAPFTWKRKKKKQ